LIPRSKTDYRERVVKGTPYLRWLKKLWAGRADHYWDIRKNTLRDFEVKPGNRAWFKAVDEVQNIFPGTASWLFSCSDAEGGWGRWVRYGGGSYYPGYEYTDAVGNWMQYRWSTFKGHFRHALDYITGRGLRVPPHLRDPGNVRAWLSPLATALAAGWARYTGNDGNHWSASHGNGC
jgi:hypothetical protein